MYANPKKCEFMKEEIGFLGHTLTSNGLSMDEDKVKAVKEWPTPKNLGDLQAFLGLAGYYRRFVHNFAKLTAPLTDLSKKGVEFIWKTEQEAAFQNTKDAMQMAPVLLIPDPDRPFVVNTDASGFAIGGVLLQDQGNGLQPVAYISRKLSDAEKRYPTHEQELLALVYALKQWRHYLIGTVKNKAFTDHNSLKYFSTQPKLTPRQSRWMELFQEYDVHVDYLPGRANVVADALSRRPDYLTSLLAVQTNQELMVRIKTAYGNDEESRAILEGRSTRKRKERFKMEAGLIIVDDSRVYVPKDEALRQELLVEHHDSVLSGHLGMDKTYDLLARSFYWPSMQEDVREFVRTCPTCAATKSSNKQRPGLLQPLPIPSRNWEMVSMDLIVGLPMTPRGVDSIVTFVDKLSKMIHCVPTTTKVTAVELARIFMDNIVRLHGLPERIISDRGPQFTSAFWTELFKQLGTYLNKSSAYHPETDGQTERANRTVEEMLRAFVNDKQDDWDLYLSAAEFAYNNSVNPSTGETPFYLNYGAHPAVPATVGLHRVQNQASEDFATRIQSAIEKARQLLARAQERQTRYANKKRRELIFTPGDKVLLSTENLGLRPGLARKLTAKWTGPFKVTKKLSDVAYELELPKDWRHHPVFHVSYLKPCAEADKYPDRRWFRPLSIEGTTDAYLVERLLDRREVKSGRQTQTEYLVQWQGYPIYEATWEPSRNLTGATVKKWKAALDAQFDTTK